VSTGISAAILACLPLTLSSCENIAETNNVTSTDTKKIRARTLWQEAEVGMTPAQVKSAFPNATAPREGGSLADGARCELVIENYAVNGGDYEVCFLFRHGKLTQVTLASETATQAQFMRVAGLLTSEYGPAISRYRPRCTTTTDPFVIASCDADWMPESGVNISVTYSRIGNTRPNKLLNINYQARTASEVKKL
jgi:hypothetical protein